MKHHVQRGQATIELVVMLLAFGMMFSALLFLCGFFTAKHQQLLEARHKAQDLAFQSSAGNNASAAEIEDWKYVSVRFSGKETSTKLVRTRNSDSWRLYRTQTGAVSIPFALGGEDQRNGTTNSIGNASSSLNSTADSAYTGEWENYAWRKLKDYDNGFSGDWQETVGALNARGAADLAKGSASCPSFREYAEFFRAFSGFAPDTKNDEANDVYMPHVGSGNN